MDPGAKVDTAAGLVLALKAQALVAPRERAQELYGFLTADRHGLSQRGITHAIEHRALPFESVIRERFAPTGTDIDAQLALNADVKVALTGMGPNEPSDLSL